MAFDAVNHQPRLVVSWTADQPQANYRVTTASGYDSGVISGSTQTHTLTRNLTNGTAEAVTVTIVSTYGADWGCDPVFHTTLGSDDPPS